MAPKQAESSAAGLGATARRAGRPTQADRRLSLASIVRRHRLLPHPAVAVAIGVVLDPTEARRLLLQPPATDINAAAASRPAAPFRAGGARHDHHRPSTELGAMVGDVEPSP
jgi:hypothetical protein